MPCRSMLSTLTLFARRNRPRATRKKEKREHKRRAVCFLYADFEAEKLVHNACCSTRFHVFFRLLGERPNRVLALPRKRATLHDEKHLR